MRLAAVAAPSLAGAAMLLLALGACSTSTQHSADAAQESTDAARQQPAGPSISAAATGPTAAASAATSPAATSPIAASPTAGWTVVQPSASIAPAASQAASDLRAYPSASEYPPTSADTVYSIAGVGVSGSVEYVDAYSVAYVCGPGIADDCDRFVGTPEYRIPLAADARFILLGTDMRANRPVDFAAFRQYAAGTDGRYDGSYDLFELVLTGNHQATSLTAVYTP